MKDVCRLAIIFITIFSVTGFINSVTNAQANEGLGAVERNLPLSIELTLRFHAEEKVIELVHQRLLHTPAPKNRDPHPVGDQLVFQCENGQSKVLGSFPINDPILLHADWLAESDASEPNLLTGAKVNLASADFLVVVPFSEHLAKVRLLKPHYKDDGSIQSLEAMGVCPIDQGPIQAALEQE
jgi:hypothetical protein